jgi:uncharacterized membrane protein
MKKVVHDTKRFMLALAASSAVSIGFVIVRVLSTGQTTYVFLAWNLLLAWLPLLFSWLLVLRLQKTRWFTVENIFLTFLWLGFLPNTFYIVSDLVHLKDTGSISILFDLVMFISFAWNGFVLGYMSLFLVHREIKRRYGRLPAHITAAAALLLCSFAIYLGRYLRWNSWDILINPMGLIFDVSDSFINPAAHPNAFTTTLMFFVLLTSIYAVSYELVTNLQQNKQ